MPEFEQKTVSLDQLYLDPNNYRFQHLEDFVVADLSRVREDGVQKRANARLRDAGLSELKNSILKNGYLPFEQIVVMPLVDSDSEFVVIEGNRRVAALKWLRDDYNAGVDTPEGVTTVFEELPVVVATKLESDPAFKISLMGVRHVGGIKQWGNYQRAKLVAELRDEFNLDTGEVAGRLGMSPHEVNRRYRAYKALRQMMDDEEYGEYATPDMYVLFHEAVAGRAIKEWLDWSDTKYVFDDEENLRNFYELIAPQEREDGERPAAKISKYEDVRSLREILPKPDATRLLLDPNSTYAQALAVAQADDLAKNWRTEVTEAVQALKKIGVVELGKGLDADVLASISELRAVAEDVLDIYAKLHANQS
ncbi:ParB N-terminal domain-containing protein [Mycobacterium sp. E2497]|uniref:ParB N-terminal domain-containing protein n=1 Tax=Mycobacterium sp. E2497 TaxID=1834135 RepID=UPI0007FE4368|nr:ParB N-terminal domain-containing protein [Mycobacterium sp. E2497]OBI11836.1 hypothetical protein A5713_05820 [Mycobacterium sp. E2497]